MYETPISIFIMKQAKAINSYIDMQVEDNIYKTIKQIGIDVDKDELVKALKYDRDQYIKGYNDGYKRSCASPQRWIPVDERLPEDSMFAVVTSNCGERLDRLISYYNKDDNEWISNLHYLDYCGSRIPEVIAWMPLPDPYKPARPPEGTDGDWPNYTINRCPTCGCYPLKPGDDCPGCGQRIDWRLKR